MLIISNLGFNVMKSDHNNVGINHTMIIEVVSSLPQLALDTNHISEQEWFKQAETYFYSFVPLSINVK